MSELNFRICYHIQIFIAVIAISRNLQFTAKLVIYRDKLQNYSFTEINAVYCDKPKSFPFTTTNREILKVNLLILSSDLTR